MRSLRCILLLVFVFSLLALAPDSAVAKEKPDKAVPMKIVKPSDMPFKSARIVQDKKVKEKRFLWLKKKESKVVQPKMARLPEQAGSTPSIETGQVVTPALVQPSVTRAESEASVAEGVEAIVPEVQKKRLAD